MSDTAGEETREELREGFAIASKGKPSLGLRELCALMHWLGQCPQPHELQEMLSRHGTGGQISEDQFVRAMSTKMNDTKDPEEVIQAFSVFDKDGRGHVSASDLRHILTSMGDRLDEEQVEQMLKTAMGAGQGDGQLNYALFVKSVLSK
jgi:calmodulin